jgi:hypothetical protein
MLRRVSIFKETGDETSWNYDLFFCASTRFLSLRKRGRLKSSENKRADENFGVLEIISFCEVENITRLQVIYITLYYNIFYYIYTYLLFT